MAPKHTIAGEEHGKGTFSTTFILQSHLSLKNTEAVVTVDGDLRDAGLVGGFGFVSHRVAPVRGGFGTGRIPGRAYPDLH
jgi:hypothetical protein